MTTVASCTSGISSSDPVLQPESDREKLLRLGMDGVGEERRDRA
jgi:hypothetical protein